MDDAIIALLSKITLAINKYLNNQNTIFVLLKHTFYTCFYHCWERYHAIYPIFTQYSVILSHDYLHHITDTLYYLRLMFTSVPHHEAEALYGKVAHKCCSLLCICHVQNVISLTEFAMTNILSLFI